MALPDSTMTDFRLMRDPAVVVRITRNLCHRHSFGSLGNGAVVMVGITSLAAYAAGRWAANVREDLFMRV